ncbi:hypothetical protein FCM35_KLT01060 [Carex littledalei]|uniref:CCHC-type domain-containing protein n=1 Tax=Carex littledalei TaxID=544730 RepID=A0A833R157_9POAL|nr:hypothetical protein FCM35_KLT01060 [Carex littledalei]
MTRKPAKPPTVFPNPGRSYAQVVVPAAIPQVASPYHQSTWRFYMDHNPWTTPPPQSGPNLPLPPNPLSSGPNPLNSASHPALPLPPNPTAPEWRNRCYNCLEVGHDQNDCLSEDRVCARCWMKGHQARDCGHSMLAKRQRFDPLQPRGNLGDSLLPPNRPHATFVYIPTTPFIQRTNSELSNAVVIDTRLNPYHHADSLQSLIMAACKSEIPYPLTHLADTRYILMLPVGQDRSTFINNHYANLCKLGLVAYPWSMGIDAAAQCLKFRVWIELKNLSPQQWNLDHLIPAISTFGVVLEHSPMQNVRSVEKMMAVIAIPDLANIPLHVFMWEKGMLRDIQLKVHSWMEDPIIASPAMDTTPPLLVFDEVRRDNLLALSDATSNRGGKEIITIEFDTLFSIWAALPAGDKKKKEIETHLRCSPLFEVREREQTQNIMA